MKQDSPIRVINAIQVSHPEASSTQYDAQMHHGQNRGKQETRKLSKNANWTKIGEIYKFFWNLGEIYKFCGERGEFTICIIGLGGMDAPAATKQNNCIFQASLFVLRIPWSSDWQQQQHTWSHDFFALF